jgi:hypothetical protein
MMNFFEHLSVQQVQSTHLLFKLLRRLKVVGFIETAVSSFIYGHYIMRITRVHDKGTLSADDMLEWAFDKGRMLEHTRR